MSKALWFRFYSGEWLNDTLFLTGVECGVYINLLAIMHRAGGPIPDDPAQLSRLCKVSKTQFRVAFANLLAAGKIVRVEGGLSSDFVEKERNFFEEKSQTARRNVEKRWEKSQRNQRVDHTGVLPGNYGGNTSHSQSQKEEANASSPTRVSENDPAGPKTSVRGSRIGEWRPDTDVATRLGMTDGQAALERDKFVDFWLGKAGKDGVKADWPATWRNWCRNAMTRYGLSFGGARAPPVRPPSASQRIRDEILRQHGGGRDQPADHDGPEIDGHAERR